MNRQPERGLTQRIPVDPDKVVPKVVTLLWVITIALVGLGIVVLWPALGDLIPIPATASPLAISSVLFVAVGIAVAWWVVGNTSQVDMTKVR